MKIKIVTLLTFFAFALNSFAADSTEVEVNKITNYYCQIEANSMSKAVLNLHYVIKGDYTLDEINKSEILSSPDGIKAVHKAGAMLIELGTKDIKSAFGIAFAGLLDVEIEQLIYNEAYDECMITVKRALGQKI